MKKNIIALLIFIILTGIMTYPVLLRMSNHIPGGISDSLHLAWVIAWDIHKIRTGLSGYWNTNIFYPHNLTLTYCEPLTGIALLGLPVMLTTNNIIFTYNFLFLLSFILSGFGIYLLVKHLTGNFWAGIISGIIFAFSSYRFCHWIHIHQLATQWMPFGFLYLHKFFEKFKFRHLVLFALFYVFQFLSSLQNGLFMTLYIVFFLVYYITQKKIKDTKLLAKTAVVLLFAFTLLLSFLYPYVKAKSHYGFKRSISEAKYSSAHVESYLTSNQTNRIYGRLTNKLRYHCGKYGTDRELFMGFVALFLAFIGFWPGKTKVTYETSTKRKIIITIWYVLTIFYSLIMVVFIFTGGKSVYLFNREIISHCGIKPLTNIILLVIIRLFLDNCWRQSIRNRLQAINITEKFYLLAAISAVLFSFGPTIQFFKESSLPGPYLILYYLVPGFSGIRVPARFAIMVLFGVSVLAGYGYIKLLQKSKSPLKKSVLGITLIILASAEYLSIPTHMPPVKTGENIPSVYKWLSQKKDDSTVIELPFHSLRLHQVHKESLYLYYSTYHWKRIVNGYSSYFSPTYIFITEYFDNFPTLSFINSLKILGVKYMIIHSREYKESTWQEIYQKLSEYRNKISLIGEFGPDFVYQIVNSSFTLSRPKEPDPNLLISKEGWRAESNLNTGNAHNAIDNNLKTRWDTAGPRRPGAYFKLDLGRIHEFNRIWLNVKDKYLDYLQEFTLEVSEDNKNWKVVISKGNVSPESFLAYLLYSPKNTKIDIKFTPQKARYIRVTQYGKNEAYWWAIYEIDVQ
jgi:hypothetical protein